jgi:tRNA dimethylallyltransferase
LTLEINMKKTLKKVIAIVGPTASGKTGVGVKLAKEFNGEIVSADSRQVYRGLDIGTGKDLAEYDGIRYHMIDIVDPMEKMTLFDYLPLARAAIQDILSRDKLPIIVGGTGLYVQGLVEGFELEQMTDDRRQTSVYSRKQLDNLTIEQLNNILSKIDPEKSQSVDKKNRHRLIRAIELSQEGLKPIKVKPDFEVLQIAIDLPRQELHDRIDRRVNERFEEGMLNEVVHLIKSGVSTDWLQALGLEYRVITEYLVNCHFDSLKGVEKSYVKDLSTIARDDNRTCDFETMKQQLKFKIHQFARRQITWFKRFPEINWLSDYKDIKRFVKIFLEH